ncbi:MAG: PEP-CTERM sorting domain-containing protein [Verrucomicrobiaceae bacterium]|nr:MAG: PEP-CTERM sorting domain-containing protein [Verrucomicrobiaceae bacterium]
MKLFLLPLAIFLTVLAPLPGMAALVWTDHRTNHMFASTTIYDDGWITDPERYQNPVHVMQGTLPSYGGITSTYTASNGYSVAGGYKGTGTKTTYRPGYNVGPVSVPPSNYGISYAPEYSILEVIGDHDSTVTATSDFTGLAHGSLPIGSWIFFSFGDGGMITGDAVLTVSSSAGWHDTIWMPSTERLWLISSTADQLTFQGRGAVYLRTSQPLTSLTWSATDPTPYYSEFSSQFTSYTQVSYGIAANIPEPSVTAGSLLAAGCFLFSRGRRRG